MTNAAKLKTHKFLPKIHWQDWTQICQSTKVLLKRGRKRDNMFCKNCGKQLTENAKFCRECGTSVGKEGISGNSPVALAATLPVHEKLAVMFIASVAMELLLLILRFVSFGKYYVSVKDFGISDGGTYSVNKLMGSGIETTIFVILILASIAICVFPVIKNNLSVRRRMILPKIASFWNALTIGLSIYSLDDVVTRNKESISYNYGENFFSGSWSLTFGGWLNIILTFSVIVLLFVISQKTKNGIKTKN